MPLVPHPPSTSRPASGDVPARLPSGGVPRAPPRQQSDQSALAQHKAGLPTLNFVKLKQDTKADADQALALGGGGAASQRGSTVTARARQYSSGAPQAGNGARQYSSGSFVGGHPTVSSQGARPPQALNAAPAPRRVMATGGGMAGGGVGLMPHPPPERGNGSGAQASVGAPELPDRHKVEPTHPLTARNQPTHQVKGYPEAAQQRQPMTARPTPSANDHDQQHVAPQKYDEVSKPSASGGRCVE